ncbi:MAG TPA: homocysteine S-methyltransferase family protein [Actinomycetes bacterium]|nr:homocysteine S-methyltransferase family protein [Actinomycetes bacterium]
MNRLSPLIADREPVLFDGAMGTLLQLRGLDDGGAGELWNVDHADEISKIHDEYAAAGARFLTTNTFGGTSPRLGLQGSADRVEELSEAAARLARAVAERHGALVAGDLGPTGELLAPMGTMTGSEAQAFFEEQLTGLVAGGIDVVLIETMSDLGEVEAAVNAAASVAPSLPVLVTLSFDTNLHTMMGVSPEVAVKTLADTGVDAVGANCGRGPSEMETIMEQMASARSDDLLLIAQSNAGLPQLVGDRFEYDAPPELMAQHALRLREIGVDVIGSCCGSTSEHVQAMHDALIG